MPAAPVVVTTRPLLVRVDAQTRHALSVLASRYGLSLSQVVRHATLWWLDEAARSCPEVQETAGEFLNVRFPVADLARVQVYAEERGVSRGSAVRAAVRSWLADGDPDSLLLVNPQALSSA